MSHSKKCQNSVCYDKEFALKLDQKFQSLPYFPKQCENEWQFMLMAKLSQKWSFATADTQIPLE